MPTESEVKFDRWVAGVGTSEAAKRLNCSESMISLLRRGRRKPSLEMARAIQIIAAIGMSGWLPK